MTRPEYGETWVYEGIVGAVPGLNLSRKWALAVQFLVFETAVLVLAAIYGLSQAAVAGTVAVVVATAGSAQMMRIADQIRGEPVPNSYRQLLFGSNIEVVLAVVAYAALITHLFVFDARTGGDPLLESLLGAQPPVLAVFVLLLVLWDLCYRIGAGWWASVAALWRSAQLDFDAETRQGLARADRATAGFGLLQLILLPLLLDQPVLFGAVAGHVLAVVLVTGTSIGLLHYKKADSN